MSGGEYFILMIVGGVFLLLGVGAYFWGSREQKGYDDSLATRTDDLREFVAHWPPRPQLGAMKVGGKIAIIISLLLLVTGVIFWLID